MYSTQNVNSELQRTAIQQFLTQSIVLASVVLCQQSVDIASGVASSVSDEKTDELWRDVFQCWVDDMGECRCFRAFLFDSGSSGRDYTIVSDHRWRLQHSNTQHLSTETPALAFPQRPRHTESASKSAFDFSAWFEKKGQQCQVLEMPWVTSRWMGRLNSKMNAKLALRSSNNNSQTRESHRESFRS